MYKNQAIVNVKNFGHANEVLKKIMLSHFENASRISTDITFKMGVLIKD